MSQSQLYSNQPPPEEVSQVVEHLFRWSTWEITEKSDQFQKTNSQIAEFRAQLKNDLERTARIETMTTTTETTTPPGEELPSQARRPGEGANRSR